MRQYQALTLADTLGAFHQERFTGIVTCLVQHSAGSTADNSDRYILVFSEGQIAYGDTVLPSIPRLVEVLEPGLNHALAQTALKVTREECSDSGCIREFLARLVTTKVITWPQLETLLQGQVKQVLQQMATGSGALIPKAGQVPNITFGNDGHYLDWTALMSDLQLLSQADGRAGGQTASQTGGQTVGQLPGQTAGPFGQVLAPTISQAIEQAQQDVQPSRKPTVLSVDDSPIAQKMLKRSLDAHCNMLLAGSAMEALKILNSNQSIELVFLDVNMPGVDGLEFCKAVRSIGKFKDLPIIMLTANEGRVNKVKGQIAGATLYLNKSAEPEQLLEVLNQYTGPATSAPSPALA